MPFGTGHGENASPKSLNSTWCHYKKLSIHSGLFRMGIIAVTPSHQLAEYDSDNLYDNGEESFNEEDNCVVTSSYPPSTFCPVTLRFSHVCFSKETKDFLKDIGSYTFSINKRQFHFFFPDSDISPNDHLSIYKLHPPKIKFIKNAHSLLTKLTSFSNTPQNKENEKEDEESDDTSSIVSLTTHQDVVLFNPERREEVFLPLLIHSSDKKIETVGFYVYPWLSKSNRSLDFKGANTWFTVACLFGGNLKGVDCKGNYSEMIKHDIDFYPGQKVIRIEFNPRMPNPYEKVIFLQLENLVQLINRLSNQEKPKRLIYHLPYYDYLLFGIELFNRGRISLFALRQFFIAIIGRYRFYQNRIQGICELNNIALQIESPFDNIFGPIIQYPNNEMKSDSNIKLILDILQIQPQDKETIEGMEEQKQHENSLVQRCLTLLVSNDFNEEHKQSWQEVLRVQEIGEITSLDTLLKLANSLMVAIAAKNRIDYETAVFLPVSEKQIPVSYASFLKQYKESNSSSLTRYGEVINLTFMDRVVGYSQQPTFTSNTNYRLEAWGDVFRIGVDPEDLSRFIDKKSSLMLSYKNTGVFGTSQKVIELEDLLDEDTSRHTL